jgi:hypothetical protein
MHSRVTRKLCTRRDRAAKSPVFMRCFAARRRQAPVFALAIGCANRRLVRMNPVFSQLPCGSLADTYLLFQALTTIAR